MPPLPTPFRAVLGLVATAMDEARHLPDRAIELPMLAVSTALQVSLRAQQRYATLAAKGDEFLSRRATTDEPPTWARFDDPVAADVLSAVPDPDEAGPSAGAQPIEPAEPPKKTVRRPRNAKPSPFDAVGDD